MVEADELRHGCRGPAARTGSFPMAVVAVMIAGACTFLNVYCTQPLLPYLQEVFHATEVQVSLTVGAVTLSVAIMARSSGSLRNRWGEKGSSCPRSSRWPFRPSRGHRAHPAGAHRVALPAGLFVPGVIAVIIATSTRSSRAHRSVMSAYVAGTVFGGFLGRFLTGSLRRAGLARALCLGPSTCSGRGRAGWLPSRPTSSRRSASEVLRDTWGTCETPGCS